ncbi:AraC family transcriptional regulator [Vibrio mangrovi]|nr:AraC family transcriptional regulator [Vibrio mangrovi]MDW6005263.1 AraC family transcriptional regulator [Vibrio mangrovi]
MIKSGKEVTEHGKKDFPIKLYDHFDQKCVYRVEAHWHDEYEVIWVTQGCLKVIVDGESVYLKAHQLMIVNPQQLHSIVNESREPSHHYAVVWDSALIANKVNDLIEDKYFNEFLFSQRRFKNIVIELSAYAACQVCLAHIIELFKHQPECWELHIKIRMLNLWALFLEGSFHELVSEHRVKTNLSIVKSIISFIHSHYEQELDLDEIARATNISKEYACRAFKKSTGLTIFQYINQTRIRNACYLLSTTDRKISDIAFSTGFNNLSYFSKVFREIKGMSPKEVRGV